MIHVHVEVAKNIKIAVEEMLRKFFVYLFFAFISVFFASCIRSNKVLSVSENELFALNYGNFAEQINLFKLQERGPVSTSLYMRDGFFYIVNGDAGKVVSLNSYGDLLSLFYSEDFYAQANFSSIGGKNQSGTIKKTSKIDLSKDKITFIFQSVTGLFEKRLEV